MARKASPGGSKRTDTLKPQPTDKRLRQSKGPSTPTGKAPKGKAQGGDGRTSHWGDHLQGNADKGGETSYT
jgi:hypothetical protein